MKLRYPPRLEDHRFVALFYGLTDAGKTQLLGTAQDCAETSPTLFVDIDGGALTLTGKKIRITEPANFEELQEIYDYLREDNDRFRSVCVDSLTAQQRDVSMPTILGEIDEDRTAINLARFKPPHRRDWLSSQHHMRKFLDGFRRLARHPDPKRRIHVFMSAGERVDERRDLGVPALPGVLGLDVGGYVDVLARLVLEEEDAEGKTREVRCLYTTKHVNEDDGFSYLGKNRLRRLPRRIKNPTVEKLMGYWMKGES